VTHPQRKEYFRYYLARIFLDDEWRLPMHYSSYDWPTREGGPPLLLEEYTYTNFQPNVGLTDADFNYRNEEYGFRKDFMPSPQVAVPITKTSTTAKRTTAGSEPE
jgi:hypothetical protein